MKVVEKKKEVSWAFCLLVITLYLQYAFRYVQVLGRAGFCSLGPPDGGLITDHHAPLPTEPEKEKRITTFLAGVMQR